MFSIGLVKILIFGGLTGTALGVFVLLTLLYLDYREKKLW